MQTGLVALAVKAAIGAHGFWGLSEGLLDAVQTREQQARVGRCALLKKFPIHNQSLLRFAQEQGVAKFDFRSGFVAHDDASIRFIETEDLFLTVHLLAREYPLARLLACLGE